MKYRPTTISKYELLKVFPEAKGIIDKRIKEHRSNITRFSKRKREISNEDFENDVAENITEMKLDGMDWLIEENNKALKYLETLIISTKKVDNLNFDIQKAKDFPIDSLIEINNNKTCCIFHDEKTPSMHYYKKTNSVYCFGCHKSGDSIDVAMAIWGMDFKDTVARLNS